METLRSMTDTDKDTVIKILANQKAFFATQKTKDIDFRLIQLRKLKQNIEKYQEKFSRHYGQICVNRQKKPI